MKRITTIATFLVICLIFLCVFSVGCSSDSQTGPKCKKASNVVSIDSIVYRGGWVTLENGDKMNVGQRRKPISVGDEICVEY